MSALLNVTVLKVCCQVAQDSVPLQSEWQSCETLSCVFQLIALRPNRCVPSHILNIWLWVCGGALKWQCLVLLLGWCHSILQQYSAVVFSLHKHSQKSQSACFSSTHYCSKKKKNHTKLHTQIHSIKGWSGANWNPSKCTPSLHLFGKGNCLQFRTWLV